jgi:hypothetical protein
VPMACPSLKSLKRSANVSQSSPTMQVGRHGDGVRFWR